MTDKEKIKSVIWMLECRIKGYEELAKKKDVLEVTRMSARFFVEELKQVLDALAKK